MNEMRDDRARNVQVVERFLAAFTRRWPTDDELAALLAPEVVFVERPNLMSPAGSERNADAIRAGMAKGRELLAWQAYEARDHIASGDLVVTRMRWSGELATDAGRIVHIEQHDCYEQPSPG
jgi:ketosteroid isomerase-like protein